MKIKEVDAKSVLDSRGERTIQIEVKTSHGVFSASSPSGKSKGKHEKRDYLGSIDSDIRITKNFSDKISELKIEKFFDLYRVENLIKNKIGANSLFALESAVLKALASEQKKQLWQIIDEKAKKFPFPVGNCIGGGLHSREFRGKKPDFQEFLVIPKSEKFADNVFLMKKFHELCGKELKVRKARGLKNDENAWSTGLDNEQVLEIMKKIKEQLEKEVGKKINIGLDIAASTFFTGLIYNYKNPKKRLTRSKQIEYILNLIDKFNLDYIEDPLEQEDFSNFSKLRKQSVRIMPTSIIVGDDLIVSRLERLKKALKMRCVNAIIVKPNQIGSLIEIFELIKLTKKFGIKTVFSHRSGETLDNSLADLAFGFQADYIKTGVIGKEREIKLRRLIEIDKNI